MKQLSIVPPRQLRRWFWLLLLANMLFISASVVFLRPLTSDDMVHFEMAKQVPVAESILQEWRLSDKFDKATVSVYADFLFILLYTTGLAVACSFLSRLTKHEILMRAGRFFAYLLAIAGICDVIENIAMLKSMRGAVYRWNVALAYDMAATKFSIIILSLLFIIVCLIFWALLRVEKKFKL